MSQIQNNLCGKLGSWVTTMLLGLENLQLTTKLLKDCHQMGYFLKNKTIYSPPHPTSCLPQETTNTVNSGTIIIA